MKHSVPLAVPLDLRCSGENSRRPSSPSSQHGCAATVSRRCAPPVVPANTAPSTSLPRASSSSIVTTTKVNQQRPADEQATSAADAVSMPRKRPRESAGNLTSEPEMPSPAKKLARVSYSQVSGPTQQSAVKSGTSVQVIPADGQLSTAAENDEHLTNKFSSFSSSDSTPSQQPVTVDVTAVVDPTAASYPVSQPLVLTSVNGMLVPLSSAPATIIVVNCATAASPPLQPSSSSNRLCPIAPAPPPATRQSALSSSATSSATASTNSAQNDCMPSTSLAAQRRTYRCEEPGCGKTYFKNSHLKVHRRVHTGLAQCVFVVL